MLKLKRPKRLNLWETLSNINSSTLLSVFFVEYSDLQRLTNFDNMI